MSEASDYTILHESLSTWHIEYISSDSDLYH